MTSTEKLILTEEFTKEYEQTERQDLPEYLSRYRLVSCLADSGAKKTWLLEKENGQRILCKYASGEYVNMLRTESEFFTLGKFPFVPYVYDYFETPDGAYLLREYIEGQTLSELVEREGPLPIDKCLPIIKQLCAHLSRLHAARPPIIYRDLKPSNIVLQPSGDCYMIDLGTVRTYHEDNSVDTVFIGTLGTAAPEQFGARQTDQRTDIYALGILFYYLLTGELDVEKKKLNKLPSKAANVIQKCTAFDPKDRYAHVSMVTAALSSSVQKKIRTAAVSAVICAAIVLGTFFIFPKFLSSKEITFSSPLLEQAVRTAVNKTDGEPVYEQDLLQITHLYICGDKVFHNADEHNQYENSHAVNGEFHGYGDIADISILGKMSNLQAVVLDYQQIYDISPIQDLPLTTLSLCGNPITDLSGLQGQKSLTKLYLSETGVYSLDALTGCSALQTLDCSYTPVVSLEPLTGLPIHSLHLTDTPFTDLQILSTIPLTELYVSRVAKSDFKYLENISSLQFLSVPRCGITSLNELAGFNNLSILDVNTNQITDLDGLERFTSVTNILLGNNPITDLSPLAKMGNLKFLEIGISSDVDFYFLNEMPWVEGVTIRASQLDALTEAVPQPWFVLEYY